MLQSRQFNLGRIMEREILVYARRNEGRLYYPNLIRLLCEAKDVPRFDQDEEDLVLDPMVQLSCEGERKEKVEEKAKEEKKGEEKEGQDEEVPQMSEMMMLLQQHILKQEAVWVFVKAAHEWYTLGFGENILPPPVFPNWVLLDVGPNGHAQDKPHAAASETSAAKQKKADVNEEDAGDGAAKSTAAPEKTILLDSDENDIPIPSGQQGSAENVADNEEFQSAHAGEVSGIESAAAERERKSKHDEEKRKEKEKTPVAEATQVLEPASCQLPPRSTWTRRKVCATKPPRRKRVLVQEEEDEEEEEIQVPPIPNPTSSPPAKKKK